MELLMYVDLLNKIAASFDFSRGYTTLFLFMKIPPRRDETQSSDNFYGLMGSSGIIWCINDALSRHNRRKRKAHYERRLQARKKYNWELKSKPGFVYLSLAY